MQMQWHMPIGYKIVNGKITIYEEHQKIVEGIFPIETCVQATLSWALHTPFSFRLLAIFIVDIPLS